MHSLKTLINNSLFKRVTSSLFLIALGIVFILYPRLFSLTIFGILCEILFLEFTKLFKITDYRFWVIMPFYPCLPFALIIMLNQNDEYRMLLLVTGILVLCFDTGSYFVGKLFGKHKILPQISPGKTWEGFFGGVIYVILILYIILSILKKDLSLAYILLLSLTLSIFALSGDLFESYLKRKAGIKDSGSILPGHGGFLDRFDGIMFVIVPVYIFRHYLSLIFN